MAFKIKDGFRIGTVDVFNNAAKLLAPDIRGTATVRTAGDEGTVSVYDALAFTGRAGGSNSYAATFTPATLSANRTLTVPNQTGTLAITTDIKDGTLDLSIGAAGATNTSVTIGTGTGYSANTASNLTYTIKVGPALDNLVSTMTGSTPTGFLKKSGQDSYSVDTTTYLTASTQSKDFGVVTVTDTDSGFSWAETGSATAASNADTLKVVSGSGINVDVDSTSKAIRITSTALQTQSQDFGVAKIDNTDTEYTWSTTDGDTATADTTADTLTFVAAKTGSTYGIQVKVDAANDAIGIAHADTSTQASVTNSTNGYVKNVTLDEFGHITAITSGSVDFTVSDNYAFRTIAIDGTDTEYTWGSANSNINQIAEASNDTFTIVKGAGINLYANNAGDAVDAIKIEHEDTSSQASVTSLSAGTFINSITLDTFGHITAIGTGSEVDTLASVTARGATTSYAISITNTTQASDTNTGALIVDGGVGIDKNLWVGGTGNFGGSVVIGGNLTVQGDYIIANTADTGYEDSVIELHRPASGGWLTSNDGRDIGIKHDYFDNDPSGNYLVVTGGSGDGSTATLTIANDVIYPVDTIVVVAGVTPSGFNGTYRVTASSAGQFSYANTTNGSVTTTGALGTVYRLTEINVTSASIVGTILTVNYSAINGSAIAVPAGSTVTLTGIVVSNPPAVTYDGTYTVKAGATTTSFTVDVDSNLGAVSSTTGAKIYIGHRFAFSGFANDTQAFEFYKVGTENTGVFSGIYGTIKAGTFWSTPSASQTNSDITLGTALRIPAKTVYDVDSSNSSTITQASVISVGQQTIGAVGSSITYTNAASLYIANAPTNGNNVTVTNKYAIQVAAGTSYFVGAIKTDSALQSTVTTGTAPFTVASTTAVTNLNADYLDGQHGSYYTTAGNLTGTIPSSVLGNSTLYVGTTAVALNRASANQALTGILSVQFAGSSSGTVTVTPVAVAGTTNITLPAKDGTVALLTNTLGDFASTTSAELAGVISDETGWNTGAKLVFSDSPVLTTPRAAIIYGSSSSNGTLTLSSTSNATKGTITIGDVGGTLKIIPTALPGSIAFLKISTDGTVSTDTNVYLTAESDTLATVTGRGNTTTTNIQLNSGAALALAPSTTAKIWRSALAPATINTASATPIDTWAVATYRSANYIIQITQGSKYQISEVRLIHDGTNVYNTEYAVLETNSGSPIPITFTYGIVTGTFTISATITDANSTNASLLIERTLFAV